MQVRRLLIKQTLISGHCEEHKRRSDARASEPTCLCALLHSGNRLNDMYLCVCVSALCRVTVLADTLCGAYSLRLVWSVGAHLPSLVLANLNTLLLLLQASTDCSPHACDEDTRHGL